MISNADVLGAAMTIRGELAELEPGDAEALGFTLDHHFARVEVASGAEITAIVDDIMVVLRSREPSRMRFRQLVPGAPLSFWAADWVPPGEPADGGGKVSGTCQTCGFVNVIAFGPTEDEPLTCQNPKLPLHPLKLA